MASVAAPIIAFSVGEPAGIGPDLAVKIAQAYRAVNILAIADPMLLSSRAKQLGLPLLVTDHPTQLPGQLWVRAISLNQAVETGKLNPANSEYVLSGIHLAAKLCMNREADAMVTGPVHKGVINEAGIAFSGHTEYLAQLTGVKTVVMLLVEDHLRVALATTHIPLSTVSKSLTQENVSEVLQILHAELISKFAMTNPKIAVCGLNPHAGENGHMGTEEIEVIAPVISVLQKSGMNIQGPFSADTVFAPSIRKNFDAIVAMYHDQGLAPFKALAFGESVNITLGLPIIRTSVDHGTALSLAGTGLADANSLNAAIKLAQELVALRSRHG